MLRGLYVSASSMTAEMQRVELISHNLANSATTAFKKTRGASSSFGDVYRQFQGELASNQVVMDGALPASSTQLVAGWLSLEQGPSRFTGDELNVAIDGPGFYVLETPAGERYTRDGRFRIDEEGWLVNAEGYRVMGPAGPVRAIGDVVSIDTQGRVVVDGEISGAIGVVDFANPGELLRETGRYYLESAGSGEAVPQAAVLAPGFVEESNVNVVMEMAELLAATRQYEMNQKAIWVQDEMLGKAVNEVGRVG